MAGCEKRKEGQMVYGGLAPFFFCFFTLEGSNVDLSQQIAQMIVAQRGFQVNSRMFTIISQNLQTLAQLGQ